METEALPLKTEAIPLKTEAIPSKTEPLPLSTEAPPLATEAVTSDFNPLLFFVCGSCREAFPDTDRLKNHKRQEHLEECERIKYIVFEERLLEPEWIPTENIFHFPKPKALDGTTEGETAPAKVFCHCNCTATVSLISPSDHDRHQDQDLRDDHQRFIQSPSSSPSRSRSLPPSLQSDTTKPNAPIPSPERKQKLSLKRTLNPIRTPNPFLLVKRLTKVEINSALKKRKRGFPDTRKNSQRRSDSAKSKAEKTLPPRKRHRLTKLEDSHNNKDKLDAEVIEEIDLKSDDSDANSSSTSFHSLHSVEPASKIGAESDGDNSNADDYMDFDDNTKAESDSEMQSIFTPIMSFASPNSPENNEDLESKKTKENSKAAKSKATKTEVKTEREPSDHDDSDDDDLPLSGRKINDNVKKVSAVYTSSSETDSDSGDKHIVPKKRKSAITAIKKRGRGRPKGSTKKANLLKSKAQPKAKKSVGRPKRRISTTYVSKKVAAVRGRGRPRKVVQVEEKETKPKYPVRVAKKSPVKPENLAQAQAEEAEMNLPLAEYLLLHKQRRRDENDQEGNRDKDLIDDNQNQFQQSADCENKRNIILLDPDPIAKAAGTSSSSTSPSLDFDISKENPVACRLCLCKLESEAEVRNHVENCWLHNKPRHLHCHLCDATFGSQYFIMKHKRQNHPQMYPEEESPVDLDLDKLPLNQWLEREMQNPDNLILLEPDPIFGANDKDDDTDGNKCVSFPIKCLLCQLTLTSDIFLRNHVHTCFRFNKIKHRYCIPCNKAFTTRKNLLAHNKQCHEHNFGMKCTVCERQFHSNEAFHRHQDSLTLFKESARKTKTAKFNVEDREKSRRFNDNGTESRPVEKSNVDNGITFDALFHWLATERQIKNLDGSEKIILLDPEPQEGQMCEISVINPIKCKLCSLKLSTFSSFCQHVHSCGTKTWKHVYCLTCSESFDTRKLLQEHQRSVHNQTEEGEGRGPTSLLCQLCQKSLPNESLYKVHVEMHKDPNFKPLQCPQCPPDNPKFFRTNLRLVNHLLVHGRVTKHKCGFCGKFLKSRVHLQIHERSHTGERPFKCDVSNCSRSFTSRTELTVHQKMKHNTELGLEQFLCQECGMIFGRQGDLDKHVKLRHTDDKPYQCTFLDSNTGVECSKAFKRKDLLTQHMRLHTGETPYQCSTCGKAFRKKFSLTKHQRSHEGTSNRTGCPLCPRKFPGGWELKQHLKKDHGTVDEDGADLDNFNREQGPASSFKEHTPSSSFKEQIPSSSSSFREQGQGPSSSFREQVPSSSYREQASSSNYREQGPPSTYSLLEWDMLQRNI